MLVGFFDLSFFECFSDFLFSYSILMANPICLFKDFKFIDFIYTLRFTCYLP